MGWSKVGQLAPFVRPNAIPAVHPDDRTAQQPQLIERKLARSGDALERERDGVVRERPEAISSVPSPGNSNSWFSVSGRPQIGPTAALYKTLEARGRSRNSSNSCLGPIRSRSVITTPRGHAAPVNRQTLELIRILLKPRITARPLGALRELRGNWYVPADWLWHFGMFLIILCVALVAGIQLIARLKMADIAALYFPGVAAGVLGVLLLFIARLPLYRARRFWTFGPRQLDRKHRRYYWLAYVAVTGSLLVLWIVWLRTS